MTFFKSISAAIVCSFLLTGCEPKPESSAAKPQTQQPATKQQTTINSQWETLAWEDLMPAGEDALLAELYTDFYEERERSLRQQMTLAEAGKESGDLIGMIDEGSAQDTMEQIGTYNVVADLDGAEVRIPGYVVPLDFNADSEYKEFLLVPYFGACLHTPPPPPNQIVFVKSELAAKVEDIREPVWVSGILKTGKFGSDLGNSAYELNLAKLEPYEY